MSQDLGSISEADLSVVAKGLMNSRSGQSEIDMAKSVIDKLENEKNKAITYNTEKRGGFMGIGAKYYVKGEYQNELRNRLAELAKSDDYVAGDANILAEHAAVTQVLKWAETYVS